MIDFNQLPRFKSDQFGIVSKIPNWAFTFAVEREDVERQIMFAHGWCENNPKKAPKKNVMRFLYNWMLIANRKGSLVPKREDRKYKELPVEEDMTFEEMQAIRKKNMGETA